MPYYDEYAAEKYYRLRLRGQSYAKIAEEHHVSYIVVQRSIETYITAHRLPLPFPVYARGKDRSQQQHHERVTQILTAEEKAARRAEVDRWVQEWRQDYEQRWGTCNEDG